MFSVPIFVLTNFGAFFLFVLFLVQSLVDVWVFWAKDTWDCVRSNLASWPFGTPLPPPLGGCCVLFFCVWCWCVPPLLWCAFVWVFLCLSHQPSFSQPLGGGLAENRSWWSPGFVSLFPFPLPWSNFGSPRDACNVIGCCLFHSGHLDIFYFVSSQPCEFISH